MCESSYFCAGELAEWSNAAVLKTVDCQRSGGSNPSLSATQHEAPVVKRGFFCLTGAPSVLERSRLNRKVNARSAWLHVVLTSTPTGMAAAFACGACATQPIEYHLHKFLLPHIDLNKNSVVIGQVSRDSSLLHRFRSLSTHGSGFRCETNIR